MIILPTWNLCKPKLKSFRRRSQSCKDIDKAETLAIEAVNIGAKPRNTAKEWNEA